MRAAIITWQVGIAGDEADAEAVFRPELEACPERMDIKTIPRQLGTDGAPARERERGPMRALWRGLAGARGGERIAETLFIFNRLAPCLVCRFAIEFRDAREFGV